MVQGRMPNGWSPFRGIALKEPAGGPLALTPDGSAPSEPDLRPAEVEHYRSQRFVATLGSSPLVGTDVLSNTESIKFRARSAKVTNLSSSYLIFADADEVIPPYAINHVVRFWTGKTSARLVVLTSGSIGGTIYVLLTEQELPPTALVQSVAIPAGVAATIATLPMPTGATNAAAAQVTLTTAGTAYLLGAARATRTGISITNKGPGTLYVGTGAGVTTSTGMVIPLSASQSFSFVGTLYGVSDTNADVATVWDEYN